jgi:RNA polymerase sigma factor (sigma-70 family)
MDHQTTIPCLDSIDFPRKLDAARRGSRSAQQALFQEYYPRVERIVHAQLRRGLGGRRVYLSSRFSTADVVQDVFHSLIRSLGTFHGATEGEFVAYVVKLVRNRTLDTIRHHRASCRDYRRTQGSPEEAHPIEIAPAPDRESSSGVVAAELQGSYRTALELLPEAARCLLRGRIERGLGFEELAQALGYPSRYAARRAFFAAQARLVVRMQPDGAGAHVTRRG